MNDLLEKKELLTMLGMAVQNAIEYFVINKDKEFVAKIPKLQQAHLQIREMIQKPEGLPEKRALKIDEIISKYPEAVRIVLSEFVQKLDALQQKPEVTEEFIEKYRRLVIASTTPVPELLRRMLEEAGYQIKVKVTEEWKEEKAKEFHEEISKCETSGLLACVTNFIYSLVEEMPAKKLVVSEEFVEKWAKSLEEIQWCGKQPAVSFLMAYIYEVKEMLKEAKVEVEEKPREKVK